MANRKSMRNLLRVLRYLDAAHQVGRAKLRKGETDRFDSEYIGRTKIADDLGINYDTLNEIIQLLLLANLIEVNWAAGEALQVRLVSEWRDSFLHDAIESKEAREYYDLESDSKPTIEERAYRQVIPSEDGYVIPMREGESPEPPFMMTLKTKKETRTYFVDAVGKGNDQQVHQINKDAED